MAVRIGLVGRRADLAVEVASLAAGAGAEVLSLDPSQVTWAAGGSAQGPAIDLVLIDVAAAGAVGWGDAAGGPTAGAGPGGRRPPPTVIICRSDEGEQARGAASSLGCTHVVELPLASAWLAAQVAPERGSTVLGVVGAVGGAGATTVAMACAVGAGADCLLVDADPDSAGLDLPLGIPEGQGVRWDQVPDTSEPLDPGSLRAALPWVGDVAVMTGSGLGPGEPGASGLGLGRVAGVVGIGRAEFGRTVIDLGRGRMPASLVGPGDAVALVMPATLAGVVAGRRVLERMPARAVVVLVRPSGWLPTEEVAEQLGVPVALEVPSWRRAAELSDCGDLLSGRTGRAMRQLGEQVWGQLG